MSNIAACGQWRILRGHILQAWVQAVFTSSYLHSAIIYVAVALFSLYVYSGSDGYPIGSIEDVYNNLKARSKVSMSLPSHCRAPHYDVSDSLRASSWIWDCQPSGMYRCCLHICSIFQWKGVDPQAIWLGLVFNKSLASKSASCKVPCWRLRTSAVQ